MDGVREVVLETVEVDQVEVVHPTALHTMLRERGHEELLVIVLLVCAQLIALIRMRRPLFRLLLSSVILR